MPLRKDLTIEYLGFKCENPFFLSSSPAGSCYDMIARAFETGWGGVFYKTIGVSIPDECSPRFDNCSEAGNHWNGFRNMELRSDKPLRDNLGYIARLKRNYPERMVIASIIGDSDDEWGTLAELVTESGADAIECNFSYLKVMDNAMDFAVNQNDEQITQYSRVVTGATHLPVVAKLSPNVSNIEFSAIAAVRGGAKGISAINTIKSITNIDLDLNCPIPVIDGKSSISGYSGKAVRPIALRFICQLAHEQTLVGIPLSGIGGIETWRDCVEFLLVGARNIQVCTAVMQYGYRIIEDMISGVSHYMDEKGYNSVEELVGKALPNIIGVDDVNRDFKSLVKVDKDKCVKCGRCYLSCEEGGHQALLWDSDDGIVTIDEDKCVGCQLCIHVCPVMDCIMPGTLVFKEGRQHSDIIVKTCFQ